MPDGIVDRDADVWEAMLAVADSAGGSWPERARVTAVTPVMQSKAGTPSLGIKLLQDLFTIIGEQDQIATERLLEELHKIEESPWGDMRGKPLDARGLAKRLKEYESKPATLRFTTTSAKGYRRDEFRDAWSRYLPQTLGYVEGLASSGATEGELRQPRYRSVTAVTSVTDGNDEPFSRPSLSWHPGCGQ
jgi:hypothetical protein